MSDPAKKCLVCAKPGTMPKGGICEACQGRIRREAMGDQAGISARADRELSHGVTPVIIPDQC